MRRRAAVLLLVMAAVIAVSAQEPSRPFRLGFTPFPHDISFEAVDFAYAVLETDADIVAHHFDNGLP